MNGNSRIDAGSFEEDRYSLPIPPPSLLPSRGWLFAGVPTLLFALWTIVPWRPLSVPGEPSYLDPSWLVVLHRAFLEKLVFGRDIVFTYGPWGFVATRTYVPGTFAWLLASWVVFAAGIWYAAFTFALAVIRGALWAAAWTTALLLVVSLGDETPFIAATALFIAVTMGSARSRLQASATLVLAALLAWLGLVKLTYFGLGLAVVIIATAWGVVTRSRVGPVLPVYGLTWFVAWIVAGQPVGAVPDYILNGFSVTAGYAPAMAVWSGETWQLAAFLLAGAATLVVVSMLERGFGRRFPVMAVSFGSMFYVAFKAAFVRQDQVHESIGLLTVVVVAVVITPLVARSWGSTGRTRTAATAILPALAVGMWAIAAVPGPAQQVVNILKAADDTLVFFVEPGAASASRRDGWSTALAGVRANVALPRVEGTVDLYPDDQLVLIANGLARDSRPAFQSYFAYSPRLITLNERHLRGEDRPRTLFVDLAPIDGRWPASEDAPNLMTILSDYRLLRRTPSYLMFEEERRSGYRLKHVRSVRARLGDPIAVPITSSRPIWASIDVRRTMLGRLEELAFKPGSLVLGARLADGRVIRRRLVPAVARVGFLLSPYLAGREAFAAMTEDGWRRILAGSVVRTMTVSARHDRLHGYADLFEVSFFRVMIPPRHGDAP